MQSTLTKFILGLVLWALAQGAFSLDVRKNLSPKNNSLPKRDSTKYIILHQTEGDGKSALYELKPKAKAHYLVWEDGRVDNLVEVTRIANHAGVSMWNGDAVYYNDGPSVSPFSIGIEIAGYAENTPNPKQLTSVRELLSLLQQKFSIPDERVLTHSMVAYELTNSCRGRKTCAKYLATDCVREDLGLTPLPKVDPDVQAKRLNVGNRRLHECLYGQHCPEGYEEIEKQVVTTAPVVRSIKLLGRDGETLWSLVGKAYDDATTLYILLDGTVKTGSEFTKAELDEMPDGTYVITGYVLAGTISDFSKPNSLVQKNWNKDDTLFYEDGKLIAKKSLGETPLSNETVVFVPN